MLKTTITLLLVFITAALLYSQYDERQVLLNQIRRLEARREFTEALRIYEDLLEKYPEDEDIVSGCFNTLINLNKIDSAEDLLDKYKDVFAPDIYTRHRITVLIRKGETREARQLALDFLSENSGNVNLYRTFALVFERQRQFETSVEILELARNVTNDDYLFAVELARNYENMNHYPQSLEEYVKHLERNRGFLFFVTNRVKNILEEDTGQIETLKNLLDSSDNEILLELYALSLAHTGNYEDAFLVYQRLDPEKLNKFADELFSAGNVDLARQAYENYRSSIDDPVKSADVGVKIAQLHISENHLQQAQQVLEEIAADERIQNRQVRFRTRANRHARELLAEIAVRLDEPQEEVINLYEKAKDFAFNRNEQKEVDLKIVHYLIMSEDYQHAQSLMQSVLRGEQSGSHITNRSHYYHFILELMKNNEPSDSLLTEMIINLPGSELTNEALFLTVIFHEMSPQVRKAFLEAYRLKSVYKDKEALETLLSLDKDIVDEEIIVISGQWAREKGDLKLAEDLFSHPFQNETLAGYATMQLAEIQKQEKNEYRDLLSSFLAEHPTHIFSPKLRLLLTSD